MDIRNFFGPKGGDLKGSGAKTDLKPREEEKKKKKRVQVFSDSDSDEEFVKKPKEEPKKPKEEPKKAATSKKEEAVPSKSKLKEVNASDFFNSKPVKTNPVKRKSPEKSVNR